MACECCKREIKIKCKGLCAACYQRLLKTGSTEYQRKGRKSYCSVDGCGKEMAAHGLCNTHYMRLHRHGHIDATRPDSWGAKIKHPLYHSWQWMRRFRGTHGVDSAWQDFLTFAMDVGERPSKQHKLFPIREGEPIGPKNFNWRLSVVERRDGESKAEHAARHQRIFRKLKPESYSGYGTKKNYGIDGAAYNEMLSAQNGVCAICDSKEVVSIRGAVLRLAVDHCHATGKIRGLLCSACNTAIGLMKDDTNLLQKAIEYLSAQS